MCHLPICLFCHLSRTYRTVVGRTFTLVRSWISLAHEPYGRGPFHFLILIHAVLECSTSPQVFPITSLLRSLYAQKIMKIIMIML